MVPSSLARDRDSDRRALHLRPGAARPDQRAGKPTKPTKRLDTAVRDNGAIEYGIDTELPGRLCPAIQDCPVFGGKLVSLDAAKMSGRRGVKGVVRVDTTSVAVVADSWWRAKQALAALPVVWDHDPGAKESSATIAARLKEGLTATQDEFADTDTDIGQASAALGQAAKRVEAVHHTPFVSHACMAPMNCTARVSANPAEVWVSSQYAGAALGAEAGLPQEKCQAYNPPPGGGFGRRGGSQDCVRQAAAMAKQFPDTPVKLIWSREEDMSRDSSGPSAIGHTVPKLLIEYAMRNTHVPVGPRRRSRARWPMDWTPC